MEIKFPFWSATWKHGTVSVSRCQFSSRKTVPIQASGIFNLSSHNQRVLPSLSTTGFVLGALGIPKRKLVSGDLR
jgi:hypothetical protein